MTAPSPDMEHYRKEMTMATKKKSTGKARVKVNKLKVKEDKVEELTDKDARRIRGGLTPETASKKPAVLK
jgi:hypothetical protein